MVCPAKLAQPDLRTLRYDGNVLHPKRRAALGCNDRVLDILDVSDQTYFPDIDLLQPGFDEAAARIGIVIGELLLHLGDAESVGDQFVRVEADLIFTRGTAEGAVIHDARDGLQVLVHHPVFERLHVHDVVLGVGTFQRVEIDLADRAPVRPHLCKDPGRQSDLRNPLQNSFAVLEVRCVLTEDQFHRREPEDRPGAYMGDSRNTVHHDFERDRDLLLDLFGGDPGPLRDDIDVVVRHVRIRFDRKLVERNDPPRKEQHCDR